jgi:hypothetical protein
VRAESNFLEAPGLTTMFELTNPPSYEVATEHSKKLFPCLESGSSSLSPPYKNLSHKKLSPFNNFLI